MLNTPTIPSYVQGFARHRGESPRPNLWDGLVGLWAPLLGPTGGTLFDRSPRGNHGILTAMDFAADWVVSPHGWAINLDGTDDTVGMGYRGEFSVGNRLTIALLVRRNGGLSVMRGLMSRLAAPSYTSPFALFFAQDNKLRHWTYDTATGWKAFYGSQPIADSQWHHVAFTWAGSEAATWIDGKLDKAGAYDWEPRDLGESLWIGSDGNVRRWFPGQVALAGLWNRPLGPTEIRELAEDCHRLLRSGRRTWSILPAVGGPYCVISRQMSLAGTAAGTLFRCGAVTGETFNTGSILGECHGRSG